MTSLRKNMTTGSFEVRDENGDLLASFADYWTAQLFVDEREAGNDEESAVALAEEAARAEEMERETLVDDLCELMDPSDLEAMSLSELRELANRLN